jgi:hypothetical protein
VFGNINRLIANENEREKAFCKDQKGMNSVAWVRIVMIFQYVFACFIIRKEILM